MALAVCLLFDPAGDRLVRRLWARLEDRGIRTLLSHTHRRHRPHLSLAVVRTWSLERVTAALSELPEREAVPVTFPGLLAFTRGRVSLAAGVSADLAVRHQSVVDALTASGAELHRHYKPGYWVPHVSLATGGNAAHLPAVSKVVNDALPLTVQVQSAALIDSSTAQTWSVNRLL